MARPTAVSGFTLVEMLVVMVLLSLLALGLVSAMQTMGRTQDRLERRIAALDERQVVTAFVNQVLSRLSDRRMAALQSGQPVLPFQGGSQAVQWLGILPARPGVGGRYWLRLSVEPDARGMPALVLRYLPWQGETQWPDWSQAHTRTLVEGIARFDVAYGGGDMPPQQWLPAWGEGQTQLPTRLLLHLETTARGSWPLWIVAARTLPGGGARASMYSTGPGR
ncbi:MAG: prepilin-type N-terminal cleavage/methylation domain-containing protein [Comamonas sp.]